jgi:hypothetical protein
MSVIQCTYTSFTSIAHFGAWVSVEFGFFQPIKFDNLSICFRYDQTFLKVVRIHAIAKLQ